MLVAIGCAVLAVFLARGLIGQAPPPGAPAVVQDVKPPSVPVLVAARDIALGERITGISVEWRDWPRASLSDAMITREARPDAIEKIEGARARAPLLAGEPIADRKILTADQGNLMSALVRKGLRGFAVRVSDRTAGSGFILPNDRVDIIATLRVELEESTDDDPREIVFSRTIVTNARVLAVNKAIAPDGDKPSIEDIETAVLELDQQQAEAVARAETQGELSLALRSIADDSEDGANDMPQLAAMTEIPNSVEVYKQGIRLIFSCEPRCDPALQFVNAPFPLVVRDVGIPTAAPQR
ncbi:MAG: Flp pilus assembly protein CpaB [Aestuariivirga sp.]|nr:Flp pilus assembly protein CpaB [Aestuariivirga sp.]